MKETRLAEFLKQRRDFAAVFVIFCILAVLPMAIFRLLPFVDLPNHLAAATIFKHIGEPANQFARFFRAEVFLNPNVFHLLFCSLDIFPSVEFANHVYFCLYALLLPLSVVVVIKKIGGNPWFAILSFTLINNYNLHWGFVGYVMALPLIIFGFYATLDYLDNGRIPGRIVLSMLFVVLFFVHAQAALFSMLIYAGCCSYKHRDSLSKLLKDSLLVLPGLIIIFVWWKFYSLKSEGNSLAFLVEYYSSDYLKYFTKRLKELFVLDSYFLCEGSKGTVAAIFFSLFIVAAVLWGILKRWGELSRKLRVPQWALTLLFVLGSLLCFFLLPHELPGQPLIYQRLSIVVLVSVIILGSLVYSRRLHRGLKAGFCAAALLYFALWFDYYSDFNKETASFTRAVFPEEPTDKRLAGLIYDYTFRGQPVYIHFPNYFIVWNHGIATTLIVDYRFGAIRRKVGWDLLPPYAAWFGKSGRYDGRYDNMDYLVVRGTVPWGVAGRLDKFRPIKREGVWTLYARKPQS